MWNSSKRKELLDGHKLLLVVRHPHPCRRPLPEEASHLDRSCRQIGEEVPQLVGEAKEDSKWFTKLDALHGYCQIPLAPESQKLTAFLLLQRRYYYRAAPMGLNPSGDWWCRKSDEAIAGLPRVLKLVDNILVHAPSLVELRGRMRSVLQRCHARPWHRPQQEV